MAEVLLTGHRGYIGSCVAKALQCRGIDFNVIGGRLESLSSNSLNADYVIHCAGALRNRPNSLFSSNAEGTQRLLEAVGKSARVVHVSTRGVYKIGETLLTEMSDISPDDAYGESKLLAEEFVRNSNQYVIFRATTLIGHGVIDSGPSFVSQALKRLVQKQKVFLHTPDRLQDFLYVHTFANLLVESLKEGEHWNQVFNAAGPHRSLHKFVELLGSHLEEMTGIKPGIEYRPGDPPRTALLSSGKLHEYFGDIATQPSDSTITKMMVRNFQ
ncbi:MAG: SDR family oxidoreductase [Sedimenticola sp.]